MGKKIMAAVMGVTAEPWVEGKVVAGCFAGAEVLPNCDSRKLTFTGKAGTAVAVWETAALKRQVEQMKPGSSYLIVCLGKTLDTKNGKAWAFDVEEAVDAAEAEGYLGLMGSYIAGGGK